MKTNGHLIYMVENRKKNIYMVGSHTYAGGSSNPESPCITEGARVSEVLGEPPEQPGGPELWNSFSNKEK